MGCTQTNVSGIGQLLLIFHNSIAIPIPGLRYCIPIQNSKTCLPCSPFTTVSYAGNVTTRHLQRVILFNTIELYMKERSTHAGNVPIRQLQRVISLNTSNLCMKKIIIDLGSWILVRIAVSSRTDSLGEEVGLPLDDGVDWFEERMTGFPEEASTSLDTKVHQIDLCHIL